MWFRDQVFASSSAIVAGQVMANNFFATSSTATSTFAGRMVVGTSTGRQSLGTLDVERLPTESYGLFARDVQYPNNSVAMNASDGLAFTVSGDGQTGGTGYLSSFVCTNPGCTAGYFSGGGDYSKPALTVEQGLANFNDIVTIGTSSPASQLSPNKQTIYSTTKSDILFSGASGSTYKWTLGMDVTNGGRFTIASSTALGTNDRFTITGAGNTGIGTTTPWATLAVNPTAGLAANQFAVGSSTATNFLIDNSGRVGLGTTSPGTILSIQGVGNFDTGTSTFSSSGGLNITAGCFAVRGVCVGGGTGTGTVNSGTSGQFAYYASDGTAVSSNSNLVVSGSNIGVGTSTVYSKFSVWGAGTGTGQLFSLVNNASTTILQALDNGNIGIGTTSPYAALSVVGSTGVVANIFHATGTAATSTFAGGLNVGNGGLVYDFSTGKTAVNNIALGALSFEDNAGFVSWTDLTVTSSATAGTVEGFVAQIDSSPLLSLYAESDGAGSIRNQAVGIGTSSPWSKLSVWGNGASTGKLFSLVNSASTTVLQALDIGRIGMGTTTPAWVFQIASTSAGTGTSFRPQLALTDTGATTNQKHWTLGSLGGNFYLGTSSDVFATSSIAALTVLGNSKTGVATSTPWTTFAVVGSLGLSSSLTSGTTGNYLCINTTTYEVTSGNTCSASSERFKENVLPVEYGLSTVNALRPVTFTYKKSADPDGRVRIGFIAEEVQDLIPELVNLDKDGLPESVDYAKLTPILVKAIQDQQLQILALQSAASSTSASIFSASSTALALAGDATFIDVIVDKIKLSLQSATDWVFARLSATLAVFTTVESTTLTSSSITATSSLVVGSTAKPTGITIYDKANGAPFCLTLINGTLVPAAGSCESQTSDTVPAQTPTSSVIILNPNTPPVVTISSTTEAASTTAPVVITSEPVASTTPETAAAPSPSPEPAPVVATEPVSTPVESAPIETTPASAETN
jgi:hypothetical protein